MGFSIDLASETPDKIENLIDALNSELIIFIGDGKFLIGTTIT